MKNRILAGISGGIVLFVWTIVSFGALPFRNTMAMRKVDNELQLHEILKNTVVDPGVYLVLRDLPDDPELHEAFYSGPTYRIEYPGGGHESGLGMLIFTVLLFLTMPVVPAWMLTLTNEKVLSRYSSRVLFITGFGILLGIFGEGFRYVFESQPLDYSVFLGLNAVVGWLLAGLVIAGIMRPEKLTIPGEHSPA